MILPVNLYLFPRKFNCIQDKFKTSCLRLAEFLQTRGTGTLNCFSLIEHPQACRGLEQACPPHTHDSKKSYKEVQLVWTVRVHCVISKAFSFYNCQKMSIQLTILLIGIFNISEKVLQPTTKDWGLSHNKLSVIFLNVCLI